MSHLQDCYYFFLSSCNRKPCQFRHCEQALGSEVVCELWRVGRCKDLNCTFRHMIPNKDRSGTPCWFETQPQGCKKPHCVFQHSKPRQNVTLENLQNDLILPTTDSFSIINNHTVESKSSEINISIDDDESDDPENNVEEKQKVPSDAKPSEEQEKLEKIFNFSPSDDLFNTSQKFNEQTDEAAWENELTVKQSDNRKVQLGQFRSSNAKSGLLSPQDGKIDCTFAVKSIDEIRKEREASEKSSNDEVKNLSFARLQKRALEIEQDSDNKLSISKPVKIRRNRYSIPSTADQPNVSESKSSPQLSPTQASTPLREVEKSNNSPTELDFDFDEELSTCLPITDQSKNEQVEVNLEDDDLMNEIDQLLRN